MCHPESVRETRAEEGPYVTFGNGNDARRTSFAACSHMFSRSRYCWSMGIVWSLSRPLSANQFGMTLIAEGNVVDWKAPLFYGR
jgi:hypothetical protein